MALREGPNEGNLEARDLREAGKFEIDRPWTEQVRALLSQVEERESVVNIAAFATKQASNVDVWERQIRVPCLTETQNALSQIEVWEKSGFNIAFAIWQKDRKERAKNLKKLPTELRAITSFLRPHVEHIVSQRADKLPQGGEDGWKQAALEWQQPLRAAARSLAPDYASEALLRRREIERALPRCSEPKPEGEKPKRGKKK